MGRFETGGDDLDSRSVTEATHPSYYSEWGLLRGAVLLGPAPTPWQAVSRRQSAANSRRLKVATENAEALTDHSR